MFNHQKTNMDAHPPPYPIQSPPISSKMWQHISLAARGIVADLWPNCCGHVFVAPIPKVLLTSTDPPMEKRHAASSPSWIDRSTFMVQKVKFRSTSFLSPVLLWLFFGAEWHECTADLLSRFCVPDRGFLLWKTSEWIIIPSKVASMLRPIDGDLL